jgi:hypothetical protein
MKRNKNKPFSDILLEDSDPEEEAAMEEVA